MIKKYTLFLAAAIMLLLAACGNQANTPAPEDDLLENTAQENTAPTENEPGGAGSEESSMSETGTNALGAMTPEDALEYMKNTPDLVIVDVAATRWYSENHFEGAINIPIEELDSTEEDALYMELPTGRPVIMHCRLGMIVPGAYARVLELRPDIPEIAYIDGKPPFDEFNE